MDRLRASYISNAPGLEPGRKRKLSWACMAQARSGAAAFRLPHAGASAVSTAPGAAAGFFGKPARADRALTLGVHIDDDGAVLADAASDVNLRPARIDDMTIADADRIAIARVADACPGDDHNAPDPVITRYCLGRPNRRGGRADRQNRADEQTASP